MDRLERPDPAYPFDPVYPAYPVDTYPVAPAYRQDPAYHVDPAYRLDRLDRMERMRPLEWCAPADRAREPIYARLVTEWQAQGRSVPAEPDVLFAVVRGFFPRARSAAEAP